MEKLTTFGGQKPKKKAENKPSFLFCTRLYLISNDTAGQPGGLIVCFLSSTEYTYVLHYYCQNAAGATVLNPSTRTCLFV